AIRWFEPKSLLTSDSSTIDALVAEKARAFLAANAGFLDVDPSSLRPSEAGVVSADGGRLRTMTYDVAPFGVRVVGGRVTLAISSGSLIYVHAVGTGDVMASPQPDIPAGDALARPRRSAAHPGRSR